MFEGPDPGSREYRELTHLLDLRARNRKRWPVVSAIVGAAAVMLAFVLAGGADAIGHL